MKYKIGYIDGSMDLSAESPIEKELDETVEAAKMNKAQLRNYIYERVLERLNEVYERVLERLNEDNPSAVGAIPGADPMVAGGAAPVPGADPTAGAGATNADPDELPGAAGPAYKQAEELKKKLAQASKDNTGGAPGFNPQGPDKKEESGEEDKDKDDKSKELSERIFKSLKGVLY